MCGPALPPAGRLLAIAVLLGARAASGDASPVDVFVAGTPDCAARLERALGVADRSIRWVSTPAIDLVDVLNAPRQGVAAAARVWIDCSRLDRVRLYFANWSTQRFLVRDVPLEAGLNELALETVAQMIDGSLAVLVSNERAGMSRAEMTSVLQPVPADDGARPSPSRWQAAVSVFYSVQAFAPDAVVEQGPGVAFGLGVGRGPWIWAGWASVQYELPEIVETNLIGARLDTVSLRAGIGLARPLAGGITLEARVGGGVDAVYIAPRLGSGAQSASLSADRFSWQGAARVAVGATASVAGRVVVSAALLADLYPDLRHYDVSVDGTVTRVVTPWQVRPGVTAGLGWP
ncbi:MAG TPA: hypothetical protein VEK07_14055 [Polyangiaceae bacterium]|nr:hypothetical protein [Polyangiaceae bacterium]